ncbi:MAG: Major Facilitator Superfamily transporter [Modestobacter sp.]|nr:Major Facilitator Superfamily transporter [Modestobacter sp.]MCW2698374.1 Major Facilitator Superfamily transporter [Modestobacter sp.]
MQPFVPSRRLSRPAAFWTIAIVQVIVLVASGAPSPLYRIYAEEFGFGSALLTVVFGVYAFALLLALLVVGGLSDHVGRRPVITAALVVEAASMVLFLLADGLGWLLAARIVQGLATGAITGAFGAALLDLQDPGKPRGSVANAASPAVGLALGAVGAGLAVQHLPSPTAWVFGSLTAICLLAAVGIGLFLPESSPRLPGVAASLVPRVEVPAPQRRAFWLVLPCLLATWSLGGFYASLSPSVVADIYRIDDHAVGTLPMLALNALSLVGSVATLRVAGPRAMVGGGLVLVAGMAGTIAAVSTDSVAFFLTATLVSGAGFGAAFAGALGLVTAGVAPGRRAGLLAAVFTSSYLAFSLPAIAAGVTTGAFGLQRTVAVYGAVVIVLTLVSVVGVSLDRRRTADAPVGPVPAEGEAALAR